MVQSLRSRHGRSHASDQQSPEQGQQEEAPPSHEQAGLVFGAKAPADVNTPPEGRVTTPTPPTKGGVVGSNGHVGQAKPQAGGGSVGAPPSPGQAQVAAVHKPAHAWHADRRIELLQDESVRHVLRENCDWRKREAFLTVFIAMSVVVLHGGLALVVRKLAAEYFLATTPWAAAGTMIFIFGAAATVGAQCAFLIQALNHELCHVMPTSFSASFSAYIVGLVLGTAGAALCHIPWSAYYFSGSHQRHHRWAGSRCDVDADAIFFLWQPTLREAFSRYLWLSLAAVSVPFAYALSLGYYALIDIRANVLEMTLVSTHFILFACVCYYTGIFGAVYLLLSSFFSMGFLGHPLVGFWLLQHLCVSGAQPTVSYYGSRIWNTLCLNELLHMEHHDFANLGWRRLPRLREAKPELYSGLYSESSIFSLIKSWLRNDEPWNFKWDFGCRATWGYAAPLVPGVLTAGGKS